MVGSAWDIYTALIINILNMCVLSCILCVRLSVIPWTAALQAPLCRGFSSKIAEWVPGDLPDPGIEPMSPVSPAVQIEFFIH